MYHKFTDLYPNYSQQLSTREETAVDAGEQEAVDPDVTKGAVISNTTGSTIFIWLGVAVLFVVLMSFTGKNK